MFGKIVNNNLIIVGYKIQIENGWITKPTEEQLRKLGYKTVEYTERPEYDKEEEKLVETYTDGETITVSYEVVALTDEEHNEVIKKEIEEEEKKITDRRQREFDLQKEGAEEFIRQIDDNIVALRAKLRATQEKENGNID